MCIRDRCYTGAWTARLESQQVISQDGISPELAGEIRAFARDREWKVQTFINDYAYMAQPDPLEQEYSQYRIRKTIYTGEDFYHPAETVTPVSYTHLEFRGGKFGHILSIDDYLPGGRSFQHVYA